MIKEVGLRMGDIWTVNFHQPRVLVMHFVRLWFVTKPPNEITSSTSYVHLEVFCFCRKTWTEGQSHNKFKGANEEFGSCSSARRNHFQRWQGPMCYDGSSRGSTPYLDRWDDDLKMTQMKGAKCKIWTWVVGRKTGPNRPRKGMGRPTHSDRPRGFCGGSARPLT
jgi:hypothetical protein